MSRRKNNWRNSEAGWRKKQGCVCAFKREKNPPQTDYIRPHAFKVSSPLLWLLTRYDVSSSLTTSLSKDVFLFLLSVSCTRSSLFVVLPSLITPRLPESSLSSVPSPMLSRSPFSNFYPSFLVPRNDWRKSPCTLHVDISFFILYFLSFPPSVLLCSFGLKPNGHEGTLDPRFTQ